MYEKRWRKIKALLEEKNFDAYVVKQEGNVRYLCCSHIPSFPLVSYVIIPKKGAPLAVAPSLEEFRAREECAIDEIYIFSEYPGIKCDGIKVDALVTKILKNKKLSKVLTDVKQKLSGIYVKEDNFVFKMREVKCPEEIKKIKKACRIASSGSKILDDIVKEGKTELEVANELDFYIRKKGAQCMAFPTIMASGRNSAYSHHDNSAKKINSGDSVICDFGAYYQGYCSDITRTVLVGNVTEQLQDIYNIVLEGKERATKMVKDGEKFKNIDLFIRNFFKKYRYDKYFVHSTGHGVGLEIHEAPKVSCTNKDKILQGNVFTIEPGIYVPKKFGVRIEDVVLVAEHGAKILT